MSTEAEVDEPVESETDTALAAVALVVAGLLSDRGGESEDDWYPLLLPTVGPVLTHFLISTLRPMGRRLGRTEAEMWPVVRRQADVALRRAAEHLPGADVGPTSAYETDGGRLARAVVVGAREAARYDLATKPESGVVYKVWRTRRDDRVRPTHGGLEGNQVPLSSDFVTHNLNHLRYPGDPLAPISETAGCRCRVAYKIGVAS